jgi:hypothetical protein
MEYVSMIGLDFAKKMSFRYTELMKVGAAFSET